MLIAFILTLFLTCFGKALIPGSAWVPFCAYLAFVIKKRERLPALWQALLCGVILDFLAVQTQMGLNCLALVGTTFLLHTQKWRLFHDRIYSLAIYTFVFSILYSLQMLGFGALFAVPVGIAPLHILFGAICDAILGFLAITMPITVYGMLKRIYNARQAAKREEAQ